MKKKHPKLHSVVLSEKYVDTSAGSGLVHCAPGCGPEDKEVGDEYSLPPFNQLTEKGSFEGMNQFDDLVAKKDDKKFIDLLKKKGSLLEVVKVEHEYPHCWRCHNPVVFRATEQWFLKIKDVVDKLIKENKGVLWIPKFGKAGYDKWTENLRDNSIVRQRFWGCPLPLWKCEKCGNIEIIESIKELKEKSKNVPEDLHIPFIDKVVWNCKKCKGTMKRDTDVLDVWIDAGTAGWNCLFYPSQEKYFKEFFPADFILEATEQVRLWFSMLNICSIVALNKRSYNSVYMHFSRRSFRKSRHRCF
jgi:isoleucyl-tRNA synthetase